MESFTRGALLLACFFCSLPSCERHVVDAPLPPEDDLYAYSVAVAERLCARFPGEARPLFNLGKVHQRFGMENLALELYHDGLELEPEAADVLRDIGFILSQREHRLAEAIEYYQESLRADWSQKGIYSRICLILTHAGRLDEALEALQYAVLAEDVNEDTYYNLGQAYRQQNELEQAADAYRKALALAPNMRSALYALSECLRMLGRTEEASDVHARFTALKEIADKHEREAPVTKSNEADLRQYASMTWSDAADFYLEKHQVARTADERQRFLREAFHGYEKAIAIDPSHRLPYEVLVSLHRQRGETEKAWKVGRQAVEAIPDDPRLLYDTAGLYVAMADTMPEEGGDRVALVQEAIRLLGQAVELVPELSAAHLEIAKLILFRARQPALVPTALKHALAAIEHASPPQADNYDILAFAYMQSGRPREARETLAEGVRKCPQSETLRKRLRAMEARLGGPESSR